ncbi:MAG TPA: universal stress protein, partial [Lacibacter sp.]|nr:universal stress protein [Lacibacter sp.]
MKKILVPTDFSETALKALVYAAEIALKSAGTVYLLHVITPDENRVWRPHVREDDYGKALTKERLTKLDSAWKSMLHTYPDVNIVTELANGPVTTAILDFAEQQQMDLVVMGTTGASGLKQLLMGSVAASTIGKTAVPVLTVPASYEMKEPRCLLFAT